MHSNEELKQMWKEIHDVTVTQNAESILQYAKMHGQDISERDAYLQAWCDYLYEDGKVITAENLASLQDRYSLENCQEFLTNNQ